MAQVSISAAARLAGMSRGNLYRRYISKGKISIDKNTKGQPVIDTSELLRVFGELQQEHPKATVDDSLNNSRETPKEAVLLERIRGLEELTQAYREEIEQYREREKALRHLLTAPPPKKRRWFPL